MMGLPSGDSEAAAGVGVDRIFGALHPGMSGDLAGRPVGFVEPGFLVADEGEDEGALRLHARPLAGEGWST